VTSPPDHEPVRLSIPANPRFLSAARVVAASLGAESGLSVDDLEDLRLGVNELVSCLMDGAEGHGRIDLELDSGDGSVTVRGEIHGGGGAAVADELTMRILEAVADHHELDGASFTLTKVSTLRDEH
jgi:anti-sigma regulatory factor (Ser/Thr protein kinase)